MQSLSSFFIEVSEEIKQITWPEKREFFFLVIICLLIILSFSIFFAVVDGFIGYCIEKIIKFFI